MNTPSGSSERNRMLLSGILVTALVSMGLAAVVAKWVSSGNELTSVDPPSDQYDELIRRLEQLEERVTRQESETSPRITQLGERALEPTAGETEGQELMQRLARLEQFAQARQEAERRRAEEIELMLAQQRALQAPVAAAAADLMLDPAASEQDKMTAWRNMQTNAADYWTDTIVAEAIRIGTSIAGCSGASRHVASSQRKPHAPAPPTTVTPSTYERSG